MILYIGVGDGICDFRGANGAARVETDLYHFAHADPRCRQPILECGDDGSGCTADLSKLVDARFVLSGQLAKIGAAYQLTLQLVDTTSTKNAGRSSKLAGSLTAVRELVPYAVSEATGSPLPPPPLTRSHW